MRNTQAEIRHVECNSFSLRAATVSPYFSDLGLLFVANESRLVLCPDQSNSEIRSLCRLGVCLGYHIDVSDY